MPMFHFYYISPYICAMEELKKIYCRYEMVCDNPAGAGVELYHMPEFFAERQGMETDSMHLHGFYEIIWFQQGSGVHHIDFKSYTISAGSIFIISPGQIHSFDRNHDQQGIVLKVCTELFDDFITSPQLRISESDAAQLDRVVEAIEEELKMAGSFEHKEALKALVKLFVIKIFRSANGQEEQVSAPLRISHKAFLEFRKLIEENYCRLHTVKDYAALMNMTSKTLTLHVKDCSSYSPLELINNRIILEAKRLLRYSVLSVKEIAFRLGFEDPSYFAKFFKRIVRVSPADFRESLTE